MADLLQSLGIGGNGVQPLSSSIDEFQQQNMSISDIVGLGNSIPRTLGGIPVIGSRIPGLGNVPIPGISAIDKVLAPLSGLKFSESGTWESLQYASDLNTHHPKFKFLFKVGFYGFNGRDFYYYVLRADKPKVKFVHQDVNYYNFKTRVLTGVSYDPISITFFDEIGNSLNDFFVGYLKLRSGVGSGKYGIEQGFGEASSSKPYSNGYSETNGQRIIVEQVYANGTQSNRYVFINPRIENFDFDELSMEESNTGSHATITFSYDAIDCYTVYGSTIHSWGNVDLLRGGGTSGEMNGGSNEGVMSGNQTSAVGNGIYGSAPKTGGDEIYDMIRTGADAITNLPNALTGLVLNTPIGGSGNSTTSKPIVSSAGDTISQGIQGTLKSIVSGANTLFRGKSPTPIV